MSKENNSRQPSFSFVAQSDNTKVKRPVVSTPIQRTLKPGEYPGYDKALQILRNKDLIENSAKREIAGYLKTDKKSMPRVWKALTGTFFWYANSNNYRT